jgi:hypothetical protein
MLIVGPTMKQKILLFSAFTNEKGTVHDVWHKLSSFLHCISQSTGLTLLLEQPRFLLLQSFGAPSKAFSPASSP